MRKRQSLYLVVLALLVKLAVSEGSFFDDGTLENNGVSYIPNAFITTEKDGVVTHSMHRDFTVSSFLESIMSPYHLLFTNNKVVFKGNDHVFILCYLNLANQISEPDTSSDISFDNFKELKIASCGGMSYILKARNINFTDNTLFSFSNNLVPIDVNWSGCIQADNLNISSNKNTILNGNKAQNTGAVARVINKLTIANNDFFVASNNWGLNGGCFTITKQDSIGTTKICNNRCLIFENNQSTAAAGNQQGNPGGGVILQQAGPLQINNNSCVVFFRNQTSNKGGAIACQDFQVYDNEATFFISNISAVGGGAIDVVANIGKLYLEAKNGDILFHKNMSGFSRNSIKVSPSSKGVSIDCSIQAKKNHKIHFNDPVDTSNNKSTTIIFNSKDSLHPNSGKIIFSLKGNASKDQNPDRMSKISQLLQEDGIVVVKDGATLACRNLSQTGGWLILGAGGASGTYIPVAEDSGTSAGSANINLSRLGIDVQSLLTTSEEPPSPTPQLIIEQPQSPPPPAPSNDTITVSGPIYLTDENMSWYEYDSRTAHPIPDTKLLELQPGAASTNIDVTQVDLTTQPFHYGYQGKWSLRWEKGTGGTQRAAAVLLPETPSATLTSPRIAPRAGESSNYYLVGSWVPNGKYIPSPKLDGKLLADTIVSSNFAINALIDSIDRQDKNDLFFSPAFRQCEWKHDIQGSFLSSIKTPKDLPFEYRFSGFSTAASAYSALNNQFGLAVSKIHSHTNHKDFQHKISSPIYSATLFSSFYPQRSSLSEVKTLVAVSRSNNTFKNEEFKPIQLPKEASRFYKILTDDGIFLSQDENKSIRIPSGTFRSQIITTQCDCFLRPICTRLPGTPIPTQIFPFCSAQAFFSELSKFENDEQTLYSRKLKQKHSATHLFLPVGARMNVPFYLFGNFAQIKVSGAYTPLVYKKDITLAVSLPSLPHASWEISNSKLPRNSAKCHISPEIIVNDWIKIHGTYSLHYIYSSLLQSANVGIQTIF